jgi:hypothetical protein
MRNIVCIAIGMVMLYSCGKPDFSPKIAGTYTGVYTNTTDTFNGDLFISVVEKNKVNITVLINSGNGSITSTNVIVDCNDPDEYDFGSIPSLAGGYHVGGTYYDDPNMINLYGFNDTLPSTRFVGYKQ